MTPTLPPEDAPLPLNQHAPRLVDEVPFADPPWTDEGWDDEPDECSICGRTLPVGGGCDCPNCGAHVCAGCCETIDDCSLHLCAVCLPYGLGG